MPADAFQPKAWGIAEDWDTTGHVLTDAGATFETDSVVATDNVFIVDTTLGVAYATTVISVDSETQLTLAGSPAEPDQTNAVYKVGEGALHTLETLATIIDDRAIDAYTILLSVLWCDALIAAFNRDETGDVYVI
jgi:hypothetical protein